MLKENRAFDITMRSVDNKLFGIHGLLYRYSTTESNAFIYDSYSTIKRQIPLTALLRVRQNCKILS